MIFDTITGHDSVIKGLKKALASDSRPQSLLFAGPSGIGKKRVALAWAQGLLCESPKNKPCGKCSSCLRVEKRQHPDLLIVEPGEGATATIKIEQVRQIQNFVSLKAYESHGKVVIIDEAQSMNAQAANALLKTLEEPPAGSYFVLVTSNKAAILPTIQSRCQRIQFGSLSTEELKKLLPDTEDWVLELAQGRADVALKFNDDVYKKLRASALKVLRDLPRARTFEGFVSLEPLVEERETALFSVQCWGQWLKTAAALKLRANVPVTPDEKPVLENFSKALSARQLLRLGQKILRLEQDIQANINKSLAFEKFWLDAHTMIQAGAEGSKNVTRE